MKLLEENVGERLQDTGVGDDFLGTTLKAQATKANLDKGDPIKLRRFFPAKETAEWRDSQQSGKNIYKLLIWKRIRIQNISAIQKTQQQKNNKSSYKIGKGA